MKQPGSLVLRTLLIFVQTISATAIAHHPDCDPRSFHGPTEYNCDACSGNKVLEIDRCVCQPGWFTVSKSCDTYAPNCKTIQIVSGVVSCTACQTLRDTLIDGTCSRNPLPFFLRSTSPGYTSSTADKTDATFFVANQCLSLNSLGKCAECHRGGVVQTSGTCSYLNTNCFETDTTNNKCLRPKAFYYIISDTIPSFGLCIGGCKTCVDGRYGGCKSCATGFYFKLNSDSDVLGNCYPCDASCKTCYGSASNECVTATRGFYVEAADPATNGTVKACASDCDHCSALNYCIHCKLKFISMDGICSTTTNTIASCTYQFSYTANASTQCLKFAANFVTGSDYKGYTVTITDATAKCAEFEFASDRITVQCKSCVGGYILQNGVCVFAFGPTPTYCISLLYLVPAAPLCNICLQGKVLTTSKTTCTTACQSSETIITGTSAEVCSPCPEWCVTCQFADEKLKCIQCSPTFALYKDKCMSTSCGDSIITLNKECDPGLTPNTCTTDCLLQGSECTFASACTRAIFELRSVATDTLALVLSARYADKVNFVIHPDIMYDTTDPAAQKFFCGRLILCFEDPSAVCEFDRVSKELKVHVSRPTMRTLVVLDFCELNPKGVIVSRKYISQVAFTVAPTAAVIVQNLHVSVSFLITTPPVAPANQDLQLTYELLDPAVCVSSVSWTLTNAMVNQVDQPQMVADINAHLSIGTPASGYMIQGGGTLEPGLVLYYNLVIRLCDSTLASASSMVEISQQNFTNIFNLIGGSRVAFLGGNQKIEFLLSSSSPNLDTNQIVLKFGDVSATPQEFELLFVQSTQKLIVKAKPASPSAIIVLEIGYPGYLSEYVILKRARAELIPAISVSQAFKVSQPISFWTSLGPDATYQTVCFSKSTSLRLFTTSAVASNYINQLNQSVGVQDSLSLQIILSKGALQAIFSFDVEIEVGAIPTTPLFTELILSTLYRDGSASHLSTRTISWGFPQANWVASLQLPPTTTASVRRSDGGVNTGMTLTNTGNKITATPALSSTAASIPISLSIDTKYLETLGTFRQTRSLLAVYSNTGQTLNAAELTPGTSYVVKFEVSVSFDSCSDLPNVYDGRQSQATISLYHGQPSAASPTLLPVVLPSPTLYTEKSLHALMFRVFGMPQISVDVFDLQAFVPASKITLTTSRSWTEPTSLLFAVWKENLVLELATYTGSTSDTASILRKLGTAAFEVDHVWLACAAAETWCTAQVKDELARARWGVLSLFKPTWDSVTDKVVFQTWESSVLKSSFVNAITTDSHQVLDADVDWIAQELTRESGQFFGYVQSKRLLYPRTSFGLVESLKPLLTLTLSNLDQHTSAVSHLFQMYVLAYQGFTSSESCSKTLNDIFKSLLSLNELRLIRYTLVSTTSFFENDLMLTGGLTLIEPIPQTQLVWVGDKVAVELKNIAFDPQLDSYELSVVVFKDTFFDSLGKLLDKFNLSSSLNKSRTNVGFTNNFELVYPKVTADTEINVYRSEDECRGTPCNANKQLATGSGTIILCECLSQTTPTVVPPPKPPTKPVPPPSSGNALTNFTSSLGETFTGIGSKTQKGANCLFGEQSECVQNKKVWLSSVSIIFFLMTVLSAIACMVDKSQLSPRALVFSAKAKLSIAITNSVADLPVDGADTRLQVATDIGRKRNPSDAGSTSSAGSLTSIMTGLSKAQAARIMSLINKLPSSVVKKELLVPEVATPLTTWAKFKLVAWYTHSITSIFKSQCRLHARKTSIFLLYLRSVYELALSMFFTLDIDQQSHNYAQKLALRCCYSVLIIGVLMPVIKKLVKGDNTFDMNALWCCVCSNKQSLWRKASEDTITEPVKPKDDQAKSKPMQTSVRQPLKSRNRTWNNQHKQPPSIHRVSPATSLVVKDRDLEHRDAPVHTDGPILDRQLSIQKLAGSSATPPKNDRFTNNFGQASQEPETKEHMKVLKQILIFTGYTLMYGLLIVSILVIMAVSRMNDDTGNWPFGYWYLIQFTLSSTFGSLPSILLQYFWLSLRVEFLNKHGGDSSVRTPWTAKPHFFFNNDVHSLADVIELDKQSDFPTPAQEIRDAPVV